VRRRRRRGVPRQDGEPDRHGGNDRGAQGIARRAFNRGFRDYELTYRACTPIARDVVARFLDEASRIAKDVANRYSG